MILVCDPLSTGFVHATVNAALLAGLRLAFPSETILFLAEQGQSGNVAGILQQHRVAGIDLEEIQVPLYGTPYLHRALDDLRLIGMIAARSRQLGVRAAIFSSVNSTVLIGLKLKIGVFAPAKVFAIPHAILETILSRPSLRPAKFFFWFGFALRGWHPRGLRYLILGDSIKAQLEAALPRLAGYLDAIHMPYFFHAVTEEPRMPGAGAPIRFGFFGLASRSKGGEQFFAMARELSARAEFVLIGHLPEAAHKDLTDTHSGVLPSEAPLSRAEMDELALSIDYALILIDPMTYRLTASATFYDALCYSKPMIALRSPYVEHHFERLGDIGYLCDDHDEIRRTVQRILDAPPVERYAAQLRTLRERRSMFGIERLAGLLTAHVGR
jgi:hypothetical protein